MGFPDRHVILKLDGQLNSETAAAFVDEVREHIKLKKHIILNFENVSYISSAGIQSLYFALDEINAVHKKNSYCQRGRRCFKNNDHDGD